MTSEYRRCTWHEDEVQFYLQDFTEDLRQRISNVYTAEDRKDFVAAMDVLRRFASECETLTGIISDFAYNRSSPPLDIKQFQASVNMARQSMEAISKEPWPVSINFLCNITSAFVGGYSSIFWEIQNRLHGDEAIRTEQLAHLHSSADGIVQHVHAVLSEADTWVRRTSYLQDLGKKLDQRTSDGIFNSKEDWDDFAAAMQLWLRFANECEMLTRIIFVFAYYCSSSPEDIRVFHTMVRMSRERMEDVVQEPWPNHFHFMRDFGLDFVGDYNPIIAGIQHGLHADEAIRTEQLVRLHSSADEILRYANAIWDEGAIWVKRARLQVLAARTQE